MSGKNLSFGGLIGLLWQKNSLDVGQDTTLSDGHSVEKFVQLFVVTDGQLEMTGDDPGLLVVTSSVTGQLENFSSQVLHDGRQIDWSAGTDTFAVVAFAQHAMDTTDGELESGTARTGLGLSLHFASFPTARHFKVSILGLY